MQHVRVDHDPQRQLLQMHQLRYHFRLRIINQPSGGSFLDPTGENSSSRSQRRAPPEP